jgi:hypothetical protein
VDKLEQIKGELLSLSHSVGFFLFYFIFSFGFSGGREKKGARSEGQEQGTRLYQQGKEEEEEIFLFPSFVVCTFFIFSCSFLSLFPSSAEKDRKIDERKKKKIQSSVKSSGWPHA